jgi:choline dehydrogenase-like flavoprotein
MRVAVIGSGPAGIACAKALVRRGIKPIVVDVGETLPPERQVIVDRMAKLEPSAWSMADREFVSENPSVSQTGVPKKFVFGSSFHVARHRSFNSIDTDEDLPTGTFARGGYSVVWGAALLPAHDSDLQGWPIRRADLEPSYRRVLADIPLSGAHDALEEEFPLFKSDILSLPLSNDAQTLLTNLSSIVPSYNEGPFICGQARLAVNAKACRQCGLCLSGCVYGAIHSLAPEVHQLARAGALYYEPGYYVEELEQRGLKVLVRARRVETGTREEMPFDYVFLAAGAIQSTRILLASLKMYDVTVSLKDSQKFILPLVQFRRSALAWPVNVALARIFVEFKVPSISSHWAHAQISSINNYVLRRLGVSPWEPGARRWLLGPLLERTLIAWCGLHSDHSSSIALSLHRKCEESVLRLRPEINPMARSVAHSAARQLARFVRRRQIIALTLAMILSKPGGGNHFGGSVPMRFSPQAPLETDSLGRLPDVSRCFVVDGSILPSIPATTMALLLMANADRIASQAELG